MIRPGIIAQPKGSSEREEPLRCELAEGGGGSRPFSIAASGRAAESPLTPSPAQAVPVDGLGAWPIEAAGPSQGGAKSRALSRTQRHSAADDPVSRLRDTSASDRAHSFAEASKVVPKHLPGRQDTPSSGCSRRWSVNFFTLSPWDKKKGVRSSIKPAAIMAVVVFGVFWRL